jgi:hypothetical protein
VPQLPQLAPVLLAHPAMYPQLAAWLTQQQATTAQGTATTATPTAATGIAPTGTPALLAPDDDETVLTSAVSRTMDPHEGSSDSVTPTDQATPPDDDDDETVLTSAVLPGVAAAGAVAAGAAATGIGLAGTSAASTAGASAASATGAEAAGLAAAAPAAAAHTGVTAASATGLGANLTGTSAAGTASAAGAGSTGAAHTAAAAGAAKAGGLGLGAKLGIGAAAVTLAAGGGTAGYTAWHNAQTPATETTQTTPSHASLTEDALRQLLKTAPLTDNDRTVLSDGTDLSTPSTLKNFTDGKAYAENWTSPTPDAGGWTYYADEQPRELSIGVAVPNHYTGDTSAAGTALPLSETTAVFDINGDGADDVLAFVTDTSVHGGTDSNGIWYAALTAYTPTADGSALEVLDQLVLVQDNAATTAWTDVYTGIYPENSDYGMYNSTQYLRYELARAQTVDDSAQATLYRYTYGPDGTTGGDVTYRISWRNDTLALGELVADKQQHID